MNFFTRALSWRPLPWTAAGALVALVMLWTFTATPRYRSTALLQVTPQESSGGLSDALASVPGGALLGISKDNLETEMGVLRSRRVLDAVIDSLSLTVRRIAPAGDRDAVVEVRLVEGVEPEGTLIFTRTDDGAYRVSSDELAPAIALPERVAVGDSLMVGNVWLRLRPALAVSEERRFTLQVTPRYSTRRAMLDRLEMMRPSTGAQLIALTFDDADPGIAARALEVMIGEYIRYTSRAAGGDARATADELARQLQTLARGIAAMEVRGVARGNLVFYCDPTTYWEIASEGLGTSNAGGWAVDPAGGAAANPPITSAWGVPLRSDPNWPSAKSGTGLLIDKSEVQIFVGQDYRIDVSSEAGSRFDQNITGFRAEEEFGFNAQPYVRTGRVQEIIGL